MKRIWVTWEFQRRNIGLSSALGWRLVQIEIDAPRIPRYLLSLWRTFKVVISQRPDVMAVQNPSIVLAVFAVFLARFFKIKLIVDAHNSGIYPSEGGSSLLMVMANWVQKKADLVIVTNETLKDVIISNGGRSIVLPDKISEPPAGINKKKLDGKANIAFICTYSEDEPYREVIEAARLLSDDVVIYLTGRYDGKVYPNEVPSNVRLLGFISENDYWVLLRSVDIVMDLTKRDNCLVCGAYEAVALDKPLILSDTRALKEYFDKGCVYVAPSTQSIANGIEEAFSNIGSLQSGVISLHNDLNISWMKKFDNLVCEIDTLTRDSG